MTPFPAPDPLTTKPEGGETETVANGAVAAAAEKGVEATQAAVKSKEDDEAAFDGNKE